ncbi:DUF4237 domain-containing protein [Mycobacteroides abscessus]|nr:DUF4237 domain-containing protein [Mycobacteroides abscessus]SKT40801.1 putative alanine and proline rich protein [Mycobacteroides abscessus subsp. massiliense]SKU08486.1 putative alanine and proline rich protein [Mycobacteroides abscessus subsp. massiliense]
MGIEIPGAVKWVGDKIGEPFPEGDETAVRRQAERWRDYANKVKGQKEAIEAARNATLAGFASGQIHDALDNSYKELLSGETSIDVIVSQLEHLADAVENCATEIEFAKLMYIANLVILAATLIALAASMAFGNVGAPAEGAAAVAATEVVITQGIRYAIQRLIQAAASRLISRLAMRALAGALINGTLAAGTNAGIQGLQMAMGHRKEFDLGSTLRDGASGAVAGAIAMPILQSAGSKVIDSAIGNQLKNLGAGFLANAGGSVAAQFALTGQVDLKTALRDGLVFGSVDTLGLHQSGRHATASSESAGGNSLSSATHQEPALLSGDRPAGREGSHATPAETRSTASDPARSDVPLNLGGRETRTGAEISGTTTGAVNAPAAARSDGVPAASAQAGPSAPRTSEAGSPGAGAGSHSARSEPNSIASQSKSAASTSSGSTSTANVAAPAAHHAAEAATAARSTSPAAAGEKSIPERPGGDRALPERAAASEAAVGNQREGAPNTNGDRPASDRGAAAEGLNRGHERDSVSSESRHDGSHARDETSHGGEETRAAHARATADEALSRRIPPVDAEGIRTPLGNGERAPGHARDNADWWSGLREDEQRALIETYPQHVGNAEGIPLAARHEANSNALANARHELQNKLDSGERLTRPERKAFERLNELDRQLETARSNAEAAGVGGPHILAFDPKAFGGDGRALVSFGENPYKADSVSWHVPGLTTTIDKLGTNMDNALNHLRSVKMEDPHASASSIAWIGYDAPSGKGFLRVIGHGLAREGGNILHSDISGFNIARDAVAGDGSHFSNNHVFGHSYGSTTTSYAGQEGRLAGQVRTVTLLGSPGAGPHRSADTFGIGRENVFVASSSRDWVTTLGGRDTDGRFLRHFGLGRDPAMESWGGRRVTAEFPPSMDNLRTAGTHSAYYHFMDGGGVAVRSESLANFGRIASGHHERLDFETHRTVDGRPGWQIGLRTDEPAAGRPLRLEDGSGHDVPVDRGRFDPRWHSDYSAVEGADRRHALEGVDDGSRSNPIHDQHSPHDGGTRDSVGENPGRDCLLRTADALGELTGRPIRIDAEPTSSGLPARLIFEETGSAAHFSNYAEVAARLRELGDGSSALVASRWAGGHEGGHVVLAVNRGGEIHLVDRSAGVEHGGWPPSWGDRAVDRVAVGYFDAHGNPVARLEGDHSLRAADAVGDVAGRRLYDSAPEEPAVHLRPDLSAREGLAVTERRFPDWTAHILPDGLNKQLASMSETAARSFIANHPDVQHVNRTRAEFDYPPGTHREFPGSHVKEIEVTVGRNTAKFTVVDGVPVHAKFSLQEVFTGLDRSSNESAAQRSLDLLLSDDAGHMSGFRFTLDQGSDNLFAQDANFNRGAYKVMENEWAAFAVNGGRVEGNVDLVRDPSDPLGRPTEVRAGYKVYDSETGRFVYKNHKIFDNTPGESFQRLTTPEIRQLLSDQDHAGGSARRDPIHSSEPSGPGWRRSPDGFDGQVGPTAPWLFSDDPVDQTLITPDVAKLIDDSTHLFGLDPRGVPYNAQTYAERFNLLGPAGEHWMNFPDNGGAVAGTRVSFDNLASFLNEYGERLDRIGPDTGSYLGLMENGRPASWEERALHIDSLRSPYSAFTLDRLPSGWTIEASEIAPGMGQRGGGIQVQIRDTDNVLQSAEVLEEIGVLIRDEC